MFRFVTQHLADLARAVARYGPVFLLEVVLFWLIIKAVDSSGYGHPSATFAPTWYPVVSFLLVAIAMGAGEARFQLYRRVWSVAGLNDAFAVGLAVIEASLLVILVNLIFPDGYRPFRVLAPILAAPAVVIAIGLVRLVPRLRTSARPTGNRLLVVIPDASGYATVKALQRVVFVACGTAFHAAMLGRAMIERLAGLSAEVDLASEFRYRDAIVGPETLVVAKGPVSFIRSAWRLKCRYSSFPPRTTGSRVQAAPGCASYPRMTWSDATSGRSTWVWRPRKYGIASCW